MTTTTIEQGYAEHLQALETRRVELLRDCELRPNVDVLARQEVELALADVEIELRQVRLAELQAKLDLLRDDARLIEEQQQATAAAADIRVVLRAAEHDVAVARGRLGFRFSERRRLERAIGELTAQAQALTAQRERDRVEA
ncbi:MAG: hypothetical protein WD557_05785 [Dehalococcoidia bacterium]